MTFKNLSSVLDRNAEAAPDRRAYTFLQDGRDAVRSLTPAQLHRLASQCAALLRTRVAAGDRVLVVQDNSLDFLIGFMGCLFAGVVAVPLPPLDASRIKRTLPRLRTVAADCEPAAVLACARMRDDVNEAFAAERELRDLPWLVVDDPSLAQMAPAARHNAQLEDLAFLQYTSGSTAAPKGVMITHGNVLDNLARGTRAFGYTPASVNVNWMPYFHDYGLIDGLLNPLYAQAESYLMSPVAFIKRPWTWLNAASTYGATHIHGPNFAYQLCVERGFARVDPSLDLRRIEVAACGAEPIRVETIERFAAAAAPYGFRRESCCPAYGLAEVTLAVAITQRSSSAYRVARLSADALEQGRVVDAAADAAHTRTVVSCGEPCGDTHLRIVHPSTGVECADDQVGELWVSSPSVARGYWRRPDITSEVFGARTAAGAGPMLRTGDLAFLRGGELYITGRLKDVLIVNGSNHYPQDIEQTVEAASAAIRSTCVAAFTIDDAAGAGEVLVIAAELAERNADTSSLFDVIRTAVAREHELACHAIVLLPRGGVLKTSSGKLQRAACKRAFLDGAFEPIAEWRAPRPPAAHAADEVAMGRSDSTATWEAWLRAMLARRRQIAASAIDAGQSFAAFGLTSLETVEIAAEIEERLQRPIPPTALWEYPSLRAFAAFLAGDASAAAASAPEILALDGARADPAAIVGLACRFPGARSIDAFWQRIVDGAPCFSQPTSARFAARGAATVAGYLDDVFRFDAAFFGVSDTEARALDPQQRLLLETTWHALEHAGIAPASLAGTRTGVFVGASATDYAAQVFADADGPNRYAATGSSAAVLANRLSYFLDTRGPSLTIDTACSASLVAVHQACLALAAGDCDLAIVGGVNALLSADATAALEHAQMLSPTGDCLPFDAGANGYVRGEGCGVIVLQRRRDAMRDGRRIAALVRGGAVVQDGRSNGLTAPNGEAQRAAIAQATARAGVATSDIDYVEAHGTGTPLGDPIELHALGDTYGRGADGLCWIGAVKATIGHLEGAAGIAGLIKTVLALEHDTLPGNPHLRALNPLAQIAGTRLAISTAHAPWPPSDRPRMAAVSSFGFGGTLAHVIVSDDPATRTPPVTRPRQPFGGRDYRVEVRARQSAASLSDSDRDALLARVVHAHPDVPRAALVSVIDTIARLTATDVPALPASQPSATAPFYEVRWIPVNDTPGPRGAFQHFVIAGRSAIGEDVAAALMRAGLRRAESIGAHTLVLYTASDPERSPDAADVHTSALALLATIAECAASPTGTRVWALTRNGVDMAVSAAVAQIEINAQHAALWGIARSAALECPDVWGGIVDVARTLSISEADVIAARLLAQAPAHDQLAWRNGRWLAPTLAHIDASAPSSAATAIQSGATYWVVGGTGALGRTLSQCLLDLGAGRVVVSARHEPPEPLPRGVSFARADLQNTDDLRRVLADIDAGDAPFGGVVHAAGIGREAPIGAISAERFADIATAKIDGARALHTLLVDRRDAAFICCSSIAGIWGAAHQAHYAAANAHLDALCAERRRMGLRAQSIAWGPWNGGGLVTADIAERLTRAGLDPMSPSDGAARFKTALALPGTTIVAADVRWPAFIAAYTSRRPSAFFDLVSSPPSSPLHEAPAVAAVHDRTPTAIRAHVRALVVQMLGGDRRIDDTRGFFDLGLDSLAIVGLKQRLSAAFAVELSNADLFNHPNVAALSERIAARVAEATGKTTASPTGSSSADALSRDELLKRIADEFNAMPPSSAVPS